MEELYVAVGLAAAALLFCAALCLACCHHRKKHPLMPLLQKTSYAHRGLHDSATPENSLAAFKKAVDNGFGIELDVQLSADGQVMVFHDYTLVRMTGADGKLSEKTAEELKELNLNCTDETIPLLTEVLELVDGKVPLLVELKGENANTHLCGKVHELIREYNGYYVVESFNPLLIHSYKKLSPSTPCGLLITKFSKDRGISPLNLILDWMALNFLSKPDFIAFDHRYKKISLSLCRQIYRLPEMTWTIRDEEVYNSIQEGKCAIFEGFIPKSK
jgi:glycerophosphoryl diester phosphodiesterase